MEGAGDEGSLKTTQRPPSDARGPLRLVGTLVLIQVGTIRGLQANGRWISPSCPSLGRFRKATQVGEGHAPPARGFSADRAGRRPGIDVRALSVGGALARVTPRC